MANERGGKGRALPWRAVDHGGGKRSRKEARVRARLMQRWCLARSHVCGLSGPRSRWATGHGERGRPLSFAGAHRIDALHLIDEMPKMMFGG